MRLTPAVLVLALCAAPAAFAQTTPPGDAVGASPSDATAQPARRHPSIWTLDVNHDGMISREEAQSRRGLLRHFDQIDSNHDGQLDRGEIRAWHQQKKAEHQARMQQDDTQPSEQASSGG